MKMPQTTFLVFFTVIQVVHIVWVKLEKISKDPILGFLVEGNKVKESDKAREKKYEISQAI